MSAKAQKRPKTNALRLLEKRGIQHEAFWYDESIKTADGVAEALGFPASDVFKTLVMLRDDSGPMLVMAPGDREVDPRVLGAAIGAKSVRMAPRTQAEALTGLHTGGIGALALVGKPFDFYLDSSAGGRDHVLVNGGRRGLNIRLSPADLMAVTGARLIEID
jgi:Cys-tRNA(Pro)/Cys-tRNA(Cys) deacylase